MNRAFWNFWPDNVLATAGDKRTDRECFLAEIGGPVLPRTLRITHVYRREAGQWQVVHEHSNWEGDRRRHLARRLADSVTQ